MKDSKIKLIIGLGNPGSKYENTRHNIGFMLIDALAAAFEISVSKNKFNAYFGKGNIHGSDVVLVKPQSYMNLSGIPTMNLANFYRAASDDMIVIHDDIDLAFGKIKIKEKGGDGGHKGIRSIKDAFGGGNFVRLRIGVGRPRVDNPERVQKIADYVLNGFSKNETEHLDKIISAGVDAIVTILRYGSKSGMNNFNNKMLTDL